MTRPHVVTRYGCLNPTDLVTHVAIGLCVQTRVWVKPVCVRKLLNVYILQVVYFVYSFAYSMTNIKRLMNYTPKMSDNACSLHCYDTTDNNVKVH